MSLIESTVILLLLLYKINKIKKNYSPFFAILNNYLNASYYYFNAFKLN